MTAVVARLLVLVAAAAASACAQAADAPTSVRSGGDCTNLVQSAPASGATVKGDIASIDLEFDPPVRLEDLTITGPSGTMAVMIHPVGEVRNYQVPVSALGPGSYTVKWTASEAGQECTGAFQFAVIG